MKHCCTPVLPSVYDESLSYQEQICKMYNFIKNFNAVIDDLPDIVAEQIKEQAPIINKNYIDVNDFGAVANDPEFDNSGIFNDCFSRGAKNSLEVIIPSGTYYIKNPLIIPANASIRGRGVDITTIKTADQTNIDMFISSDFYTLLNSDYNKPNDNMPGNMSIAYLTIDGNMLNNTSGNGVLLFAYNVRIDHVKIYNIPQNGIKMYRVTSWIPKDSRGYFMETNANQLTNIVIANCGETGIYCNGVSDSYYENVIVMTTSLKNNNQYYGIHFDGNPISSSSAGRLVRVHCWSSSATIRPKYQLYAPGDQEIECTCSHFEAGASACVYVGNYTSFDTCRIYASSGENLLIVSGSYNSFSNCLLHQGIYTAKKPVYVDGHGNYLNLRFTNDTWPVVTESDNCYINYYEIISATNKNTKNVKIVDNISPTSMLFSLPAYNYAMTDTNKVPFYTTFNRGAGIFNSPVTINNNTTNVNAATNDIIYIVSNANSVSVNISGANRPTGASVIVKNQSSTRTIITVGSNSDTKINGTAIGYIGVDGGSTIKLVDIDAETNSWITI